MSKRPRTPHFITGLGDGNVRNQPQISTDDLFKRNKQRMNPNVRSRIRKEKVVDEHRVAFLGQDAFSASGDSIPEPDTTDGPWQISAFALLAIMGLLVGLLLHLVTDSSEKKRQSPRSRRQPLGQTKKKKTDEWSDDERIDEAYRADNEDPHASYFPYQPRYGNPQQQHRHRKGSRDSGTLTHRSYYLSGPVVSSYKGPSSSRHANASPKPAMNSLRTARSTEERNVGMGLEGFEADEDTDTIHKSQWASSLHARPLSPVSSFSSINDGSGTGAFSTPGGDEETGTPRRVTPELPLPPGVTAGHPTELLRQSASRLLSPGTDDMETPRAGTKKPTMKMRLDMTQGGSRLQALSAFPSSPLASEPQPRPVEGGQDILGPLMSVTDGKKSVLPFIPNLDGHDSGEGQMWTSHVPPRSISVDELHLVQMESGSVPLAWHVASDSRLAYPGHIHPKAAPKSEQKLPETPPPSTDSNDPRKNIIHKRPDITLCTDAESSLMSPMIFSDLTLISVIGGGGFGQVWKATWRGTPVAVKVLTGSAQRERVSKAILEEFAAEINMLKGMRHPNICLYMGACVDPPNRAIITELAANGSLWDALRLPLASPYVLTDGTTRTGWPLDLYSPSKGSHPITFTNSNPPLPPKGTWPWNLTKRVACGAARGMTYLHSGKPPVLHRDLKSANLLLDESYTAKVCDFGLSRLKAQERSMTGNCGTVQWMAPEVLANQRYAEPADVYSFGIILWEMLTGECPYDGMTAIQCALAVLNRDQRPEIPKWCPSAFSALIKACVVRDPSKRPTFAQILLALDAMP